YRNWNQRRDGGYHSGRKRGAHRRDADGARRRLGGVRGRPERRRGDLPGHRDRARGSARRLRGCAGPGLHDRGRGRRGERCRRRLVIGAAMPDPRWTGPPEIVALIFEAGNPASVLANNAVWVTETANKELAAGLSTVNSLATAAQWQGMGAVASMV